MVAAAVLMAVYCTGFLALQLLLDDGCGARNMDCDGFGAVTDVFTGDAFAGVVLNIFIVYGLVHGQRWARICAVGYYGLVAGFVIGFWPVMAGVGIVSLALGVPCAVVIVVLLVCRPARRWTE